MTDKEQNRWDALTIPERQELIKLSFGMDVQNATYNTARMDELNRMADERIVALEASREAVKARRVS